MYRLSVPADEYDISFAYKMQLVHQILETDMIDRDKF